MAYELTFYYLKEERAYDAGKSPRLIGSTALDTNGSVTLKFEDDDTSLEHWGADSTPAKLLEDVVLQGPNGPYTIYAGTELALSSGTMVGNITSHLSSKGQAVISGLLMKKDGAWVPIHEDAGLYIMTGPYKTSDPEYDKPQDWPPNARFGIPVAHDRGAVPVQYNGSADMPCFTLGTWIETPQGARLIEDLRVGDLVSTRDHGPQPIRWIGSRKLSVKQLHAAENLHPILVRESALAPNVPGIDILLSPQHRLLLRSKIVKRLTGEDEVLAPVCQLAGWPGIVQQRSQAPVTYLHLMFDHHEIIQANGCWAESLYLGTQAKRGLSLAARQEMLAIFPELMRTEAAPPAPARQFLRGKKLRELSRRSTKNRRSLVE